jgi:hypothetical protein
MKLKRIGVLSAASIGALLYAAMGLIGALFVSFFSMAGLFAAGQAGEFPPFLAPFLGLGAVIVLPIFYGVIGFIACAIGSALYNGIASLTGGVELEFVEQPGLPPEHQA